MVHLQLSETFKAESGAFTTAIRGTTHNWIGGSRMATSDHKRSQPPQKRLVSKDPRVTSSQTFTSTNLRGEHKPMHNAMARAQVLKSFTLKSHHKQLMLMGGEERKNKEEHQIPPRSRSKSFPSLRGEIDWWNGRSRYPLSFPSNWRQESWRNREIAKLKKVNNGGKHELQELVPLGKKGGLL